MKDKNLEFEAKFTESNVIISGKDFIRKLSPEGFIAYAKGIEHYNNINKICNYDSKVIIVPISC